MFIQKVTQQCKPRQVLPVRLTRVNPVITVIHKTTAVPKKEYNMLETFSHAQLVPVALCSHKYVETRGGLCMYNVHANIIQSVQIL